MHIKPGIPHINEYNLLLKTKFFSDMESFSNNFIELNKKALRNYKWSKDPLHHWSRQWEYPYVYDKIFEFNRNNNKRLLKILDAGSGATFFPFFIMSSLSNVSVTACDNNSSCKDIFSAIQKNGQFPLPDLKFDVEDLHNFTYDTDTFDVVYCISVLEHVSDVASIMKEFKRVLKPDGILILTFDISIDGKHDMPASKAENLLQLLYKDFPGSERIHLPVAEQLKSSNILTTKFVKTIDKNLLPWKEIFGTGYFVNFKYLTCICQVFKIR